MRMSHFLKSTPGKSPLKPSTEYISPEKDINEKIQLFDRKLAEIQEELAHSHLSVNDPYKISLHSMKTISKDDETETTSNSAMKSLSPFRQTNRAEVGKENVSNHGNLKVADFGQGSSRSKQGNITYQRDFDSFFKEMKLK